MIEYAFCVWLNYWTEQQILAFQGAMVRYEYGVCGVGQEIQKQYRINIWDFFHNVNEVKILFHNIYEKEFQWKRISTSLKMKDS